MPDIDAPQDLRAFFVTIRTLAEAGTILAYHDRSFDGGLFATLTEMAFAGRTGISVNLDMLTFDPQSADWGDYKIRPEQVAVQRDELTLKALFSEEAGAVIQVPAAQRRRHAGVLRGAGLSAHSHVIGGLNAADEIEFYRDGKKVWGQPRAPTWAAPGAKCPTASWRAATSGLRPGRAGRLERHAGSGHAAERGLRSAGRHRRAVHRHRQASARGHPARARLRNSHEKWVGPSTPPASRPTTCT